MFINTQIFKKLVKEAFNQGAMNLSRVGKDYIIHGNYWAISAKAEQFPNKEKAAVVELAGDMPAEGESFLLSKEEKQIIIGPAPWTKYLNDEPEEFLYITQTIVQEKSNSGIISRILQNDNMQITTVNEMFISMLNKNKKENETQIEGPYVVRGCDFGVFFRTNLCTLMAAVRNWSEDANLMKIKKMLEMVELPREW